MQDFEDYLERNKMLSMVRNNMNHYGDDYERRRMADVMAMESEMLGRGGCDMGGILYGGKGTSAGAKKAWATRRANLKKKAGSKKSGSKATGKKKLTKWNRFVAHVAQCNPNLSGPRLMKKASKLYKKSGSKKGSKKGKGLMYSMSGYGFEDDSDDYDDEDEDEGMFGDGYNTWNAFLQHRGNKKKVKTMDEIKKKYAIAMKDAVMRNRLKEYVKDYKPKSKSKSKSKAKPKRKAGSKRKSRVYKVKNCGPYMI